LREIKFRFWDKKNKRMIYYTLEDMLSETDGGQTAINGNWDDVVYLYKLDNMEYTGLKDKNGKEIYEGDIVKWTIFSDEYIGQVLYSGMAFTFFHPQKGHLYDINMATLKVIGNIYENSELLKERT